MPDSAGGGENVRCFVSGESGCGDLVESANVDQVDVALPCIRGDENMRCVAVSAAVEGESGIFNSGESTVGLGGVGPAARNHGRTCRARQRRRRRAQSRKRRGLVVAGCRIGAGGGARSVVQSGQGGPQGVAAAAR